jgi:hypothetical protein
MGGVNQRSVLQSIIMATSTFDNNRQLTLKEYMVPNVSEKVLKLVQSYTPVVNRGWSR